MTPPPCFSLWQDDIIDNVGDFVAAAEILKERGAYKIYIMATHGLLSADAPRLIEESAIDEVPAAKLTSTFVKVTKFWTIPSNFGFIIIVLVQFFF